MDEERRISTEGKDKTGTPLERRPQKLPQAFSDSIGRGVLVTVISRGLWTSRLPGLPPRDCH
jgi:hypothetical protein